MTVSLAGRVAIVTGAGRGIGRAIALKLASEGARVVVSDLDEEPAVETVNAIRREGGEAEPLVGDVTDESFPETVIGHTLQTWNGLDIVINNAGYIWNSSIQKHTDEQWYAMLDIHATAPFRLLRAAGEYIREAAREEKSTGEARYLFHIGLIRVAYATRLFGREICHGRGNAHAGKGVGPLQRVRQLCSLWLY